MHANIPRASPPARVVLLHSSAGSARQWQALAERLQPGFETFAIDFHGHGAQPAWRGKGPFTLADDAALARPLLEAPGGVHLVGHSYGAAVALSLASRFPKAVRSLAVYEPVLFQLLLDDAIGRQTALDIFALDRFVRERMACHETAAAAQRFVDFWSGAGAWERLPHAARDAVASRMSSVAGHFDALLHQPSLHLHSGPVHAPTLVLAGARTKAATRRIAEILHAALAQAHHEVLPEMGHMGPITHAAVVNRRIEAFLRANSCAH